MNAYLPLATTTWDDAEADAMARVIQSGMFTMGQEVFRFEQEFAAFLGSKYCVMVNSGSSANLLMVAALCFMRQPLLRRGDEVIVPAVSWSTTYYPFSQYGLNLRFVDIDSNSLNLDVHQIDAAITPQTRAICAVNLLGNPCALEELTDICDRRGLILIEDNCESMGATVNGRQAGSFGKVGSFSTFFSHHISTMEGGMVVTDDEEIHQILLCLRAHGWTRNLPKVNFVSGVKDDNSFRESFHFVLPGYNVRPLEISGAVGREQVRKLPQLIAGRRKNASVFKQLFDDHPVVRIQSEHGESSWFGFAMIVRRPFDRMQVLGQLDEAGIEYRPVVAGNFLKNPVIKYLPHSVHGNLAEADRIDADGFFVGNHHYDIGLQLGRLRDCLDQVMRKSRS